MKNKRVSMQMIADQLGISKVSVSKALSGQPGISDKLRAEVNSTALKLGYNKKDTAGKTKRNNLAFIVPKKFFLENENFYTTIYYYLNKRCQSAGQILSNYVINNNEEINLVLPDHLAKEYFDGIFVAGEIDNSYLHELTQLQIPIVLIDFYKSLMTLDCIITDNFYLGYSATIHLIENGHRNIGFVGDIKETTSILDRYCGYRKALSTNNLKINDDWHIVNNDPQTGMYMLDCGLPGIMPTAFVSHCDMAAYFLIQSLIKAGYSVPDDVSVISFDNTDLSRATTPKLTTFDIDRKEIALRAFNQMMVRITDKESEPRRIYINNRFIDRDSVRKI